MNKARADFAVTTKDGIIDKVGHSSVLVPKTNFNGKGIKWFDDTQLIKKRITESGNKVENK